MDHAERIAALEKTVAELREMVGTLAPKPRAPRAASVDVAGAIDRVTCTYVHKGARGHFCFHRHRCVYLLLHEGVVTYVGRSVRGYSTRYSDHAEKAHDTVVIADVAISSGVHAETAFQALEAALVEHFKPRLNVAPLTSLLHPASLWPTRELFRRIVTKVAT